MPEYMAVRKHHSLLDICRYINEHLRDELVMTPGVGNIKSSFALKQVKYQTALPLPVATVAPKVVARRKGKR